MSHELNFIPEQDYIFIEHIKMKQTTMASGIVIAEVNKHTDTLVGKVVSVSPHSEHPIIVKKGDTVYFTEVGVKSRTMYNNKEYLVVSDKDLLGYQPKH